MTVAVILAGGAGRRLGGCDKPLLSLGEGTILDEILCRVGPQIDHVALSVREDQKGYRSLELPLLVDQHRDKGPLSGLISALRWGRAKGASTVLTLPGDTPFLPHDLVRRLGPAPSCASSRGRAHPLIALWQVAALPEAEAHMRLALHSGNHRDLALWPLAESLSMRLVSFECIDEDPFFNINTAEDLAHARRVMARTGDQSTLCS